MVERPSTTQLGKGSKHSPKVEPAACLIKKKGDLRWVIVFPFTLILF